MLLDSGFDEDSEVDQEVGSLTGIVIESDAHIARLQRRWKKTARIERLETWLSSMWIIPFAGVAISFSPLRRSEHDIGAQGHHKRRTRYHIVAPRRLLCTRAVLSTLLLPQTANHTMLPLSNVLRLWKISNLAGPEGLLMAHTMVQSISTILGRMS